MPPRRASRSSSGPPYDERPALNVYEVPADGTAIAAAPAGHRRLATSRRFEAWGRC